MITMKIPANKLTMVFCENSVTIKIKDIDSAQFSKMAGKMAEQGGAAVTLKGVTMWEGF